MLRRHRESCFIKFQHVEVMGSMKMASHSVFWGIPILRSRNFMIWLSSDVAICHKYSACQVKPFWMNFCLSKLRDPWWHLAGAMIKKPHFHNTRLEKIALALTYKIPFLPILDHFLSHLSITTLNPRSFPIYRCNNPKKSRKLSQGSGPQCSLPPCILGCKGDQLWNPLMRSKGLSSAMLVPKIKEEIFCKLKVAVKELTSLQKYRNCKVWERWKRLLLWGGCLLICRRRAAKSDQTESTSSYTATTPTLVSLYLFSETDKWRKISWH